MAVPGDIRVQGPSDFRTTHWSVVLAANHPESHLRHDALSTLCRTYWYPLYAFVRRHGHPHHEAEDLTQDFFARLLARDGLASVRQEKGRFRAFLLASMKNFLLNDLDRKQAAKRGGGCKMISFDDPSAEERYRLEPVNNTTPENLYNQSWALTILYSVLARLQRDYADAGKSLLYGEIHSYLESDAKTYQEIADRLKMTEGAVKMAVLRLREKYRAQLRAEIAQTVADESEVEPELRQLFASLGR